MQEETVIGEEFQQIQEEIFGFGCSDSEHKKIWQPRREREREREREKLMLRPAMAELKMGIVKSKNVEGILPHVVRLRAGDWLFYQENKKNTD